MKTTNGESALAHSFLRSHLPQSDISCYPAQLFSDFADHAIFLREQVPWCRELDWDIFAHYVLFPRINDEELSYYSSIFYNAIYPRIQNLQTQEARILEVNRWCSEHVTYQAQDARTASPLSVYRSGEGRCGEESTFLVAALRSVGIPARQVYVPRWSHCGDNHAWVEVLCGGRWHFMGACEPEPVLNRGWFTTAASRAMLVHSRIFGVGESPLHGELLYRDGAVCYYNQTARYAATRTYTFCATVDGEPAPGAKFQLQILNEGSLDTIATLTADEHGAAAADLGFGSLHVLAVWNGYAAEGDCCMEDLSLALTKPKSDDTNWILFDFLAPSGDPNPPAPLSSEQKANRAAVLRRSAACRKAWRAEKGGNKDLEVFLSGERASDREKFLATLTAKDLREVTAALLEDHFRRLPPCPAGVPEDIYWRYIACPRVALEPLSDWRRTMRDWLPVWPGSPVKLWQWLTENLQEWTENLYTALRWPPARLPEAKTCDRQSFPLVFVAALRFYGIPARLRPLDGEPEYWENGAFRTPQPQETGELCLQGTAPEWSLSRWTGEDWQLLHPENAEHIVLPAGRYQLVTAVRLPDGSQHAARRLFSISSGERRELCLYLREANWMDHLPLQNLPAVAAKSPDGHQIADIFRHSGNPTVSLWLEEGSEPTEHLLNELMPLRQEFDQLPLDLLFLVRSNESAAQPTLASLLAVWSKPQVLADDWSYDLETIARHLSRDPDCAPLAVVSDACGRAIFSVSGYQVGSAAMLLRAAEHLCEKA